MTEDPKDAMGILAPYINRTVTVLCTHDRVGIDHTVRRRCVGAVTRATLLTLQKRGLLRVELYREHADVTVLRTTTLDGRPVFGRRVS
jgi:hypothetical protein